MNVSDEGLGHRFRQRHLSFTRRREIAWSSAARENIKQTSRTRLSKFDADGLFHAATSIYPRPERGCGENGRDEKFRITVI